MKLGWKVSISAATGILLGLWTRGKFDSDPICECANEKGEVRKSIQPTDDNITEEEQIQELKTEVATSVLRSNNPRLKDLAKWGTKCGIIEVSDLLDKKRLIKKLEKVQQGRIESVGQSSHLKKVDSYLTDLKKWGTTEGIIEVSNDEKLAKKKDKLLKGMSDQGQKVTEKYLNAKKDEFRSQGKQVNTSQQLIDEIQKDYEVTQVTITNRSDIERPVTLWEANRTVSVSPPAPTDVEDHEVLNSTVIGDAVHPQGMAYNPANSLAYSVNQLSNNVSVIGAEGQLIMQIQLEPSAFPGLYSPVDIAVNTNIQSPNYGTVYVIGSVSNTLSVIDLDFQVTNIVAVGNRPVAIAFNPINENLYISNYAEDRLSIVDTNTLNVEILNTGSQPRGIGVNTRTGTVYIANSGEDTILVLDSNNVTVGAVNLAGSMPSNITYHPTTDQLYVVASTSDEVIPVNANNLQVGNPIPVGDDPYVMLYNPNNDYLYVANRESDDVTVIAPDQSIVTTLDLGEINNGFTLNPAQNTLFTSSVSSGSVQVIGYSPESSSITIDEDFEEKRQDFQHNPVVVKHAKFIFSDEQRFNVLKLREGNATGNFKAMAVSLRDYNSPQNIQNISEVNGLEGAVIDGSNGWGFTIAPHQSITMMIYFRQFDMYSLLPETSRKSIGVEMSKGLSKKLTDRSHHYNPIT
ncbi:MAG: YncE family protein [Cyclobacteriaceae bacterium]